MGAQIRPLISYGQQEPGIRPTVAKALPCISDHECHFLGCYVFGSNYKVPLILAVCRIQHHNEFTIAYSMHNQPMHVFARRPDVRLNLIR